MQRAILVALVLAASSPSSAEIVGSDMDVARSPEPKASLGFLEGTWKCAGRIPLRALPKTEEMLFSSKLVVRAELVSWRHGVGTITRYVFERRAQPVGPAPGAEVVVGVWGYINERDEFAMTATTAHFQSLTATSRGWNGDKWIWEGSQRLINSPESSTSRWTFLKTADRKSFRMTEEFFNE